MAAVRAHATSLAHLSVETRQKAFSALHLPMPLCVVMADANLENLAVLTQLTHLEILPSYVLKALMRSSLISLPNLRRLNVNCRVSIVPRVAWVASMTSLTALNIEGATGAEEN